MTKFLINKDGVYYLTTGRLLKYDPAEATSDQQKKGLDEVKRKFAEIEAQPHTWYRSVEIKSSSFSAMNTGQSD